MLKQLWNFLVGFVPENNRLERVWIIAKTDFNLRYYETSLGLVWAFLNPLFQFIIYFYIFTRVFVSGIPNFTLYLFLGLVVWNFFSEATKKGMLDLKSKLYLLENAHINKMEIFIASILSSAMGLAFNFAVFFAFCIISGLKPSLPILVLPYLILLLFVLVLGISIVLSTLYFHFRDINQIWDVVIFAGFWLTPIVYSHEDMVNKIPLVYYLNPLSGIITNMRMVLLYHSMPDMTRLIYDTVYCLAILAAGLLLLKKYSKRAVELLL